MTGMTYQRVLIAYLLTVVLAQIAFAAFPGIDLAFSRRFVSAAGVFTWAHGPAVTMNLVIRRIGEAVSLVLVAGCLFALLTGRLRRDDLRVLAYPTLCVIIASGGIANLLLKAHVGRARPESLAEFGGAAQFSPAWQVVNECVRNCSFTSGEVALATALAIPAVVITWPYLGSRQARVMTVLAAVLYVAFVALLRIGLGRHFLSDAVFSILIAAGTALVLYPLLHIRQARLRFSGPGSIDRIWRVLAERREPKSALRRRIP